MDNQMTQNFNKLAKNIINRLQNRIIEDEDYVKYFYYFKTALEFHLVNKDILEIYAESLIDAETEHNSEGIAKLKDETCYLLGSIMSSKRR